MQASFSAWRRQGLSKSVQWLEWLLHCTKLFCAKAPQASHRQGPWPKGVSLNGFPSDGWPLASSASQASQGL